MILIFWRYQVNQRIVEYVVIHCATSTSQENVAIAMKEFQDRINSYLRKGWILIGSTASNSTDDYFDIKFTQTMGRPYSRNYLDKHHHQSDE